MKENMVEWISEEAGGPRGNLAKIKARNLIWWVLCFMHVFSMKSCLWCYEIRTLFVCVVNMKRCSVGKL